MAIPSFNCAAELSYIRGVASPLLLERGSSLCSNSVAVLFCDDEAELYCNRWVALFYQSAAVLPCNSAPVVLSDDEASSAVIVTASMYYDATELTSRRTPVIF